MTKNEIKKQTLLEVKKELYDEFSDIWREQMLGFEAYNFCEYRINKMIKDLKLDKAGE